jgi:hypothetical protein
MIDGAGIGIIIDAENLHSSFLLVWTISQIRAAS